MKNLSKKHVAILAANGFEESELRDPKKALEKAGVQVDIISENEGTIKSRTYDHWGKAYLVDKTLDYATQDYYDTLILPGGVMCAEALKRNKKAITFIKSFFENKKTIAAICYGSWLLVAADVLKNRKVTSYSSIKKDIENAGAFWLDDEVVVDEGLITCKNPANLSVFNAKLFEKIYESEYDEQMA